VKKTDLAIIIISFMFLCVFQDGKILAADKGYKGRDLLVACRVTVSGNNYNYITRWDDGYCLGLVTGVTKIMLGFEHHNFISKSYPFRACMPNGITPKQVAGIVVKYLEDHPEKLDEDDLVTLLRALHDAFPCVK